MCAGIDPCLARGRSQVRFSGPCGHTALVCCTWWLHNYPSPSRPTKRLVKATTMVCRYWPLPSRGEVSGSILWAPVGALHSVFCLSSFTEILYFTPSPQPGWVIAKILGKLVSFDPNPLVYELDKWVPFFMENWYVYGCHFILYRGTTLPRSNLSNLPWGLWKINIFISLWKYYPTLKYIETHRAVVFIWPSDMYLWTGFGPPWPAIEISWEPLA